MLSRAAPRKAVGFFIYFKIEIMKNEIVQFIYFEKEVDFNIAKNNVMVNATQMAKIFGKDVFQFTRIDNTKSFIESCLKPQNCGLLGIENEEDLIISIQKSGTWMHRILALKFAAWLNSDFELWVYVTIDNILNGISNKIKDATLQKLSIEQQMKDRRTIMLKQHPEYADYFELENKLKEALNSKKSAMKEFTSQVEIDFNTNN